MMTTSPKPDLPAIEARERAATPGPWTGSRNWTIVGPRHDWDKQWSPGGWKSDAFDERICHVNGPASLNNAAADYVFIAHARTDIPVLLAEVKRQADALDAAERRIGELEAKVQAERREFADAHRTYAAQLATMAARCERLEAFVRKHGLCGSCRGTLRVTPYCYRCADSTDDHLCPSPEPCTFCEDTGLTAAARAALEGDGAGE